MWAILFLAMHLFTTPYRSIEYYSSNDGRYQIEIEKNDYEIFIRENKKNDWIQGKKDRYGNYRLLSGNLIKIVNHEVVNYRDESLGRIITLYLREKRQIATPIKQENRPQIILQSNNLDWIDGYWYSTNPAHKLEIINTRYGIKAKIIGKTDWRYYDLDNQLNCFIDAKGNKMILHSKNEASWVSVNSYETIPLSR